MSARIALYPQHVLLAALCCGIATANAIRIGREAALFAVVAGVTSLGAPRVRVVRMVFSQGTWLVAVGLGIGLTCAIGVGQVISAFFYGLPATHVPTLLGTVSLFLAIGAAASVVPAGQAVREGWRRALQQE